MEKISLKSDCVCGSVLKATRHQQFLVFLQEKLLVFKIFREPETNPYQKVKKPPLRKITFYLEDNNGTQVNVSGETLTYNFLTRILKYKSDISFLKTKSFCIGAGPYSETKSIGRDKIPISRKLIFGTVFNVTEKSQEQLAK